MSIWMPLYHCVHAALVELFVSGLNKSQVHFIQSRDYGAESDFISINFVALSIRW